MLTIAEREFCRDLYYIISTTENKENNIAALCDNVIRKMYDYVCNYDKAYAYRNDYMDDIICREKIIRS